MSTAKRVLLIAYHYPPFNVSSGLQRTLAFSRYLPEFGWKTAVLTVSQQAYPSTNDKQMNEIPVDCRVQRAFAIDAARHLTVLGRYPRWLALPDRWSTWCLGGIPSGLKLIREFSPDVIFSTYPIASAHLLGLILTKLSRIPWVADFRDPMISDGHPNDPLQYRTCRWLEQKVMAASARCVFTAPGAKQLYADRYPNLPAKHWAVVANGYDEAIFSKIAPETPSTGSGAIRLLHSGILYPDERDPRQFYKAISNLLEAGTISPQGLQIVLRATGHDDYHKKQINAFGISDIVHLEEAKPYSDALSEMLSCDGLLLFQADTCNFQIPAKLYEYIRSGKPIFAMTDSKGDTASELINAGQNAIYPLNDAHAIANGLIKFIHGIEHGLERGVGIEVAQKYNRRSRSEELATILNDVYSHS